MTENTEQTTDHRAARLPLRISRAVDIAEDIRLFELVQPDGTDLPPFTAGSHVTVQVPAGLPRKYLLCNDPTERHRYLIAVKREGEGRGGSISLFDEGREGDTLPTSLPDNAFPLPDKAQAYLFIAGGIGITPIMSMIRSLGDFPSLPWKLYYLTRSPESTAFLADLNMPGWRGRVPGAGAKGFRVPRREWRWRTDRVQHALAPRHCPMGRRLCVTDAGNNGIMVWDTIPGENNRPCDHLLGQNDSVKVDHNQSLYWPTAGGLNMPYGIATSGNWLIAADTVSSRLIAWHADDCGTDASARALAGQPDSHAKGDNRWQLPTHDSLCWPYGITHCDGMAVVSDSGNNRVLIWRLSKELAA